MTKKATDQEELSKDLVAGILGMPDLESFCVVGIGRDGQLGSLNHGSACAILGALDVATTFVRNGLTVQKTPVAKMKPK